MVELMYTICYWVSWDQTTCVSVEQSTIVLLQCGLSSFKFKSFSIKFRIWNNSSSSDVLYIQASISISPKYESK